MWKGPYSHWTNHAYFKPFSTSFIHSFTADTRYISECNKNEFCIVFPHTMAPDAATAVHRVSRRLAGMVNGLPVRAAFGIADLKSGVMTGVELIELAEQALRKALADRDQTVQLHEV